MKAFLSFGCVLVAAVSLAAGRPDIIGPDEVKPGMKGFGLTVFRGSEPERFEVEVLGLLKNVFPSQDLVLVRCWGARLGDSKIVAGMSGSPIYIESGGAAPPRLLGAIAYSWSFQVEPVAGVTPIANMLKDLEASERASESPGLGGALFSSAPGGLRPILTPVIVSGVPSRFFRELRDALEGLGLEPIQGGSGSSGPAEGEPEFFRPGDAIGVQLMRGDSDWTAIGTVTHVEGRYVLAFGHPFLLAGPWEAPITRARVEWTLARESFSFKLANPTRVMGRLIDDRQSCIVAELGVEPAMVQCRIRVTGQDRPTRSFRYEIVQHPSLTGTLSLFAMLDSIYTTYPWMDEAILRVSQRLELSDGRALSVRTVEATSGVFSYGMVSPIQALLANPFERVRLARVEYDIAVQPGRLTADIISLRAPSRQVKPGTEIALRVRLRPFGSGDEELELPVRVPEEPRRGSFTVRVSAARNVRPDVARPRNLDEYLAFLEASFRYPATSLVVITEQPTRGLRDEGWVLPALPASVVNVLSPAGSSSGIGPSPDPVHRLVDTRWVLSGSASVTLEVSD